MASLTERGPFYVPVTKVKGGRVIEQHDIKKFWKKYSRWAKGQGCYQFGLLTSKGFRLVLIGIARTSFRQTVFSPPNLIGYNEVLNTWKVQGRPALIFVCHDQQKGPVSKTELCDFMCLMARLNVTKVYPKSHHKAKIVPRKPQEVREVEDIKTPNDRSAKLNEDRLNAESLSARSATHAKRDTTPEWLKRIPYKPLKAAKWEDCTIEIDFANRQFQFVASVRTKVGSAKKRHGPFLLAFPPKLIEVLAVMAGNRGLGSLVSAKKMKEIGKRQRKMQLRRLLERGFDVQGDGDPFDGDFQRFVVFSSSDLHRDHPVSSSN